jgi:hypothetical protein
MDSSRNILAEDDYASRIRRPFAMGGSSCSPVWLDVPCLPPPETVLRIRIPDASSRDSQRVWRFLVVGWLLHGRLREEAAVSIAFYIGFLLCGAVGSVFGMIGGFFIWRRVRRPLASA